MPVRIIRIIDCIETFWMHWIFDVQQDSVSGARARRQSKCGVHGYVVALIRIGGFFQSFLVMSAAVS